MRNPIAAGLCGLLGCAGAGSDALEQEAVTFEAPASRVGHLRLSGEALRFVECGQAGEGVALEAGDTYRTLVRELGGPSGAIPAMVRLEDGRVAEIRFAGPAGQGCDRMPPQGDLEARGNEPFWNLRIEGSEATVRTPEDTAGTVYRAGAWSRLSEGRWTYQASRELEGGREPLSLELAGETCFDGMSGARYPFRAELVYGERRVEGCALEGRGAR